ncbi:MAG: hypothetical protein BWZ10_00239 [candidate division BRC1 bacterium ADurb.BinA364]|nr:MAG: hypothetical protein BWZ10_00239 [candidate division BRC1 bacterium ADurb.BinA364]
MLHLGETGYASIENAAFSDLDYAKGFSVEFATRIEPYARGGRWAAMIAKGGCLYTAANGFGIGLNQGNLPSFGQQFTATIADGTTALRVTSAYIEGMVYGILTFDAAAKTMRLYLNGVERGNAAEPKLVVANIKNSSAFAIGKSALSTFQRDVMLARLWNRPLSPAAAAALWNHYSNTGQHQLPANFSRQDLCGEWLMSATCDAQGRPGSTHIKDTSGKSNYLALMEGADLRRAYGPLALAFPAKGAEGIDKSAYLIANGGLKSLGTSVTLPLNYQFQIDESPAMDSPARKDSGWIPNYASWKPILKPGTKYYWRARVKDSSASPVVSEYAAVSHFTTEGPTDWFVRPGVYTGAINQDKPVPAPGVYGTQDGTSYENAWNGIREIVWGPGGVEAGDNLYLCGRHAYNGPLQSFTQGREIIQESGYSLEYPITIRMDWEQDPGEMWSIFAPEALSAIAWQGPDENGVYWTQDIAYRAVAEFNGSEFIWLKRQTAPTWTEGFGSVYCTMRASEPWKVDYTYIKTSDGSNPSGKIWSGAYGYSFNLGHSSNVKFYKCNFFASSVPADKVDSAITSIPVSHHIEYDGCHLRYGNPIELYQGHNDWIVRNSELHDMPYGIYTHTPGNMYNLLVEGNQIYDCGTPGFEHLDAHAVGVQNGIGFVIQNNRIWNTGEAICFWSGNYDMKENVIRHNYIKDVRVIPNGTGGHGISISNSVAAGRRTGYRIYGNIIVNTGLGATEDWHGCGLSLVIKDYIEIYNNVIVNANTQRAAIRLDAGLENPVQGSIHNNIIINPQSRFLHLLGNTSTPWNLACDNNIYFPNADKPGGFYGKGCIGSFREWQTKTSFDQNSLTSDPQFASPSMQELEDFLLQETSPAIDSGADVGIQVDFFGQVVPRGAAPDIGAFECAARTAARRWQSYQ